MLIECKKDQEKMAMGLLSYLPDFKNLANLKDEIKLNMTNPEFQLYLYRNDSQNCIGVIGTQMDKQFVVVRYLSLAPGYRDKSNQKAMIIELAQNFTKAIITALPEYTYLLKYLEQKHE